MNRNGHSRHDGLVSAELKSRFDTHYNLGSRKSKPTRKGNEPLPWIAKFIKALPDIQQANAKFGASYGQRNRQKEKQRDLSTQKTPTKNACRR
jgi:hypothetical protein